MKYSIEKKKCKLLDLKYITKSNLKYQQLLMYKKC